MKYFAGLLHGDTGSGKTRLAGTMAQQVKTLHICIDRSAPDTLDAVPGDREIRVPKDFDTLVKYHQFLVSGKHSFGGVVIDSVTQAVPNFRVELTGGSAGQYTRTQMPNWMELYERWRPLIKDYAALPMHVIFCAMSEREADELDPGTEQNPNMLIKPALETKLRNQMGGYLNALGYCYKRYQGGSNKYFITFERGGIDTKLCGASIPNMEDPTFEKVWAMIQKATIKKEDK